jgi:N-acetylmuramic acid 6-phosphate etherase
MSASSQRRSEEFLKISGQFKLGALVTESSHPVTANLSEVAKTDIAAALGLLFRADGDVVNKFREFAASGRAEKIATTVLEAIRNGGKIFFTGCGSTGRLSILLDSIWRDFWQKQKKIDWENRTFSVMAGGDYALIKSVEGFEDFTAFGEKQISDLGVSAKDVVFAITEGGETSFVIGTAWAGVAAGAKVYFVYNNPDDILCEHVQRSREVIQDARIEKINLTTGADEHHRLDADAGDVDPALRDADDFGNGRARSGRAKICGIAGNFSRSSKRSMPACARRNFSRRWRSSWRWKKWFIAAAARTIISPTISVRTF